jgi:hypothetical protein
VYRRFGVVGCEDISHDRLGHEYVRTACVVCRYLDVSDGDRQADEAEAHLDHVARW